MSPARRRPSLLAAGLVTVIGLMVSAVLVAMAWVALPLESFWADENPFEARVLGGAAAVAAGPAAAAGLLLWGIAARSRAWLIAGGTVAAGISAGAFLVLLPT